MSSPDFSRRSLLRFGALLAAPLALGGCFRPLYGPTASGTMLEDVLAQIRVERVATRIGQERIGHDLRAELVYRLNGSGRPREPHYSLALTAAESVQTTIINTTTGSAETATLVVSVNYTLIALDGGHVVTTGQAQGSASYNRDQQRFASVRAARDADERVARLLADQIRTRIASVLATAP
jgi:LPS-assembly lipoprotein